MAAHIITLLTDFGTADAFVGIMKGVILGINPDARVIDLTHAIPPQQILPAALVLRSAVGAFPAGTIHVAVVDPEVGSARRPILIETDTGLLIGPDNGVLSLAALVMGRRRVRSIENQELFRHPLSHTFHGRDVFAPVAAHLSRGIPYKHIGAELTSMVELTVPATQQTASEISGEIVYVDHFGNLVTNIAADAIAHFPAQQLSVSIGRKPVVGLVTAYAAVPDGTPLAIVGSWGMLEIAVRNGNAARMLAAGPGTPVTVVVESPNV
jgi:S-adenosyl-L-methionine hydrolase (adenosine-forming)